MSSDDDPEARIRDLERSLGEQSSELTHSSFEAGTGYASVPPPPHAAPPPPQSPYGAPYGSPSGAPFPPVPMTSMDGAGRGWIVYGVVAAVLLAVIGGTVILVANVFSNVDSMIDTLGGRPTAANGGGGGPFDAPPSRSGNNRPAAPSIAPSAPVEPAGGEISVAGVGDNRTIACNDTIVDISGVSNTVVLTGECRSVNVSGVENTVTVNSARAITASGFDNRVTYLSGTPDVQNSGDSNVVEEG
jgi:hypothetical protein